MGNTKFTNDGSYLVQALLEKINSWEEKPCEVKLDELGEKPPAMMLQPLSRARVVRQYVDGSYIGVLAFAVFIRVNSLDTRTRLNATGVLNNLGDWLEEKDENTREYKNLPVFNHDTQARSIEMSATPSIATRYDNGYEDFQVIFEMQYYKKRR